MSATWPASLQSIIAVCRWCERTLCLPCTCILYYTWGKDRFSGLLAIKQWSQLNNTKQAAYTNKHVFVQSTLTLFLAHIDLFDYLLPCADQALTNNSNAFRAFIRFAFVLNIKFCLLLSTAFTYLILFKSWRCVRYRQYQNNTTAHTTEQLRTSCYNLNQSP